VITTGLDNLRARGFDHLLGRRFGLVCNQATITRDSRHILEVLPRENMVAIFGPQHGLFGHTQDNMIEWEGAPDSRWNCRIHSLYGEHRKPTEEMLDGIDLLLIDLPDIGSRYYTFAWTMAFCLEAAWELGIECLILDRPNPLSGKKMEGPSLDPEYRSFVGLFPVPIRHGLTLGEIARLMFGNVAVESCRGWDRTQYFRETDLPWAMPSPNMPTADTALVYPGGCLLEGTTLSEGRGTTRPFEIFGAPWLDAFSLAQRMNGLDLPGVRFRPIQFEPTFQKHAGQICEGCFVHVTDYRAFEPVQTYAHVLAQCHRDSGENEFWKLPPYEYEAEKMPVDILWGSPWLRESIEVGTMEKGLRDAQTFGMADFWKERQAHLIY
jgi:uncharacterized protein YbbC (DUF1343 family)